MHPTLINNLTTDELVRIAEQSDDFMVKELLRHMEDTVLEEVVEGLRDDLDTLKGAAQRLRNAQREYMKDRGNEGLGKQVALAAEYLDEVLEELG